MTLSNRLTVSVALCASLLCAACSSTKLDFTGKSAEETAEAIKTLNKKIIGVTMQATEKGAIAYLSWTAASSPILSEKTDVRQVLYSLAQATAIENLAGIAIIFDQVDTNMPEGKSHALTLGWEVEKLQKVRWVNVADYHLFELANIEEVGPLGDKAIDDYCKNGGADRFGKEFCARAGWTGTNAAE